MTHSSIQERSSAHLEPETLIEMYRIMVLSRRLDERAWVLHRQYRLFDIGGAVGIVGMAAMLIVFTVKNTIRLYREEPIRRM